MSTATSSPGKTGLRRPSPARRGRRSKAASAASPLVDRLTEHRTRQESVAEILNRVFGDFDACHPDLWERRAYLMLVGAVYERLAAGEAELPTVELVALAKALAEHRRIEVRQPEAEPGPDDNPKEGELPDRFADVVRQVYGVETPARPSVIHEE